MLISDILYSIYLAPEKMNINARSLSKDILIKCLSSEMSISHKESLMPTPTVLDVRRREESESFNFRINNVCLLVLIVKLPRCYCI